MLQLRQRSSYSACALARLTVMFARAIILLVLGILHVCGYAHVRLHVSPGMDCKPSHRIQRLWINSVLKEGSLLLQGLLCIKAGFHLKECIDSVEADAPIRSR